MSSLSLRWLWGKSIRWQLIAGVAIVHALLMAGFVVGLVHRQKEFLLAKARQRVEFQSRLLAASSQHAVLTSDLAALGEVLSNLSHDDPMRYAIITDANGRVLAHTDAAKLGLYLTDPRSRNVLSGPAVSAVIAQSQDSLTAATPMTVNGRTIGWAWVSRDLSDDRQHLNYVVIGGLIYTLVAAGIGALFAMLLAGAILRPLRLLLAGADRLSRDQLDQSIPLTTENEVGTVTQAFNRAMAKLAEQRDALLKEVEERTRAKQEAEESNRTKDHFLAVLSHELRTPLTPVLTLAQMLEHDPELSAAAREDVITIRRNVELEAHLIDELLDLTRINRGKVELHLANLDAHEKLRQVVRMCQEEIQSKRQEINLELWAPHAVLAADDTRLAQVFWNVLKNAIKFTPPGGRIGIQTHNQPHVNSGNGEPVIEEDLIIEISDTGIGIEPDALPHVFNAFEQGSREVTRIFGGLGLGLTISKALVDLHHGELTARSEGKDRGSTFRICLPIAARTSPSPLTAQDTPRAHARQRILLVEDHPDTSMATARLLQQCGYDVQTAATVESAIRLARSAHFDLIVSDIGLPDGTGYELIKRLIAEAPIQSEHVKSIAISGFGQPEDLRRSRDAGFLEHLVKPYDPKTLIEAVDHALEEKADTAS